jgi:neutral ceramidase
MPVSSRTCLLPLVLVMAGCATREVTLPGPASPPPVVEPDHLRAGFGRADITPPPGLGLEAYGPFGGQANGYRHRLYARVILLEDGTGERIALVAVDLAQISLLLHREVARRTALTAGIGVDRLLMAATHAHSGPGHFFSEEAYNLHSAGVKGFDPAMVDFLADRIAAAVEHAAAHLTRAVAGWIQQPVWGLTRNRSRIAWQQNPHAPGRPRPPPDLPPDQQSIDPTWTMLRVDTISAAGDRFEAGAFSVFAFHPTGNPWANDLYDGDVSAIVERGLERYMDRQAGHAEAFAPRSVHLLANGVEGDVSLVGLPERRCDRPSLGRELRPGGPKTPPALDSWSSESDRPGSDCVVRARTFVNATGDALAAEATAIYKAAAGRLSGDLTLGRAFRTYDLTGPEWPARMCEAPMIGRGAGAGAEDGPSLLAGWKVFGLIDLEMKEGTAEPTATGCQAPKKNLHWLLRLVVGPLELPAAMQLSVVRLGDMLLGAIPAEPTTEVGFRLKEAMLESAAEAGLEAASAAIIGLANGYLQYVATPEEYVVQHYEGGSTLYGPGTASALEGELRRLVGELAAGGGAVVNPVVVRPGKPRALLPAPSADHGLHRPRLDRASCSADTAIARWLDVSPGDLVPADGPVLTLTRHQAGAPDLAVWDDDRYVEVRELGSRGRRGHLWEVRWTPPGSVAGRYRFTLLRWPGPGNAWEFECR